MKVAILSVEPVPTHGWGRYTHDLILALAAYGLEIKLITSGQGAAQSLPLGSVHPVLPSLTPAPRFLSARLLAQTQTVAALCRDCDLVHVTAEPYAILAPRHQPLIVTAHGTYLPTTAGNRLLGSLYRRVYRRAQIICVSQYTAKRVNAALSGLPITVIPNGVEFARYHAEPLSAAPIRAQKSGPTILAVGQVKPRKGIHLLLDAMAIVRKSFPTARLVIAGSHSDKDYYRELTAQAERLGIASAVHFAGRVPDAELLGWYHAADVFALPSLNVGNSFEGFGLVYLEASAAGLPVVGNDNCGAEDAIRDGETGFLVPQGDVGQLAEALLRLLQNPDLRRRMGEAGQRFAAEHSWDRAAARVVDLYRAAL